MNRRSITLIITLSLIVLATALITTSYAGKSFNWMAQHQKIEKSRNGLMKYKQAVNAKIAKMNSEVGTNENIFVAITFAKPLSKNQVKGLINDNKLNVLYLNARLLEKSGLRGTMGVSANSLERIDQRLASYDADFKGFIELFGYVPNHKLKALTKNPLIFLVDPSADEHLVINPKNKSMKGMFWELEDYGMVAE